MTAVLDAFLQSGGVLTITSSLVAGYDFMQDAAALADGYLEEAGLLTHSAAGCCRTKILGMPGALRTQLFQTPNSLAFLALHAAHYLIRRPTRSSSPTKLHLPAPTCRARSSMRLPVMAGLMCPATWIHGRLILPKPGELWCDARGSTGWAYGYSGGALAYQELLMADFAKGTGCR